MTFASWRRQQVLCKICMMCVWNITLQFTNDWIFNPMKFVWVPYKCIIVKVKKKYDMAEKDPFFLKENKIPPIVVIVYQ